MTFIYFEQVFRWKKEKPRVISVNMVQVSSLSSSFDFFFKKKTKKERKKKKNLSFGAFFFLLLQTLPAHTPREHEAANSRAGGQVEHAINALGVSCQHTREICARNLFPKSSCPGIHYSLTVDRRGVIGNEIRKTVAEYRFGQTEEHGRSERLAEGDQRHGDGELLGGHRILNREQWLPRKIRLSDRY